MKIAVTGSTGFIGSHLLPMLVSQGHRVFSLKEADQQFKGDTVDSFYSDVITGEGLREGFRGVDGVIHLAARNHVLKETENDPLAAYRRVNVEGTRNVILAAVEAGARWLIHFSSVKAMGEGGDAVFDENSSCTPSTPYGISKLESEIVVRHVAEETGLQAIIFRLPMVYGPGNKGNLLRMIRWADRRLPFPVFQPDNLRSMVYVENVVHGVSLALVPTSLGGGTYILKDREDYSSRRLYSSICRELGKPPRFVTIPAIIGQFGGIFSEDIRKVTRSFRVSSVKIEKELGFSPPYSFQQGITETVACYRSLDQ